MQLFRELERAVNAIPSRQSLILGNESSIARTAFARLSDSRTRYYHCGTPNRIELPECDIASYPIRERTLLESLKGLRDVLGIEAVILHGSLSDKTFCEYSDVDCLLIIRDECFTSQTSFNRIQRSLRPALRAMIQYDPLQHHGLHIVPQSLIGLAFTSYLPPSILTDAVCLGSSEALTVESLFSLTPSSGELEQETLDLTSLSARLLLEKLLPSICGVTHLPSRLYSAKNVLSTLQLLPTLALQSCGIAESKKNSFAIFTNQLFELERTYHTDSMTYRVASEVLTALTSIRADWQRPTLSLLEYGALYSANPFIVSRMLIQRRRTPDWLAQKWNATVLRGLPDYLKAVQRISVPDSIQIDGEDRTRCSRQLIADYSRDYSN